MTLLRFSSLALAVAALSMTAACGDTVDESAYADSMASIQKDTSTQLTELGDQIAKAQTPAGISTRITRLADAVEANSAEILAITPPADVAALHKQYAGVLDEYAADLKRLAVGIKKAKTDADFDRLLKATDTANTELTTNEQELVDKINAGLE